MRALVSQLLFGGVVGKVLGIARELVAAWCFGTGLVASAYRLSQAAFLLPLHGFVSDVLSGAFTPQYARLRTQDPDAAQRVYAAMQRTLLAVSVIVAAGLVAWGDHLVAIMAPGFSAESRQLSASFVAVLAPALPAYVLTGLFAATELIHGQGRVAAARASIQSIGLLLGTIAAWALNSPLLIAVGFVAAYFALLVWSAGINRKLGLSLTAPVGDWSAWRAALWPVARVFLVLMWVPISLQVSQVVERRVASEISANAVAAMDYARFITDTLLVLIAMPFGMAGQAAMPTMEEKEFRRQAERAFQLLIAVGLPLSVFIWAHAVPMVTLLFKRGAFDQASVVITSDILASYALGIVFLLVAYAGQKFLNARGRNAVVLRTTVLGVIAAVLCNLTLSSWLGPSVLGVAAALSGVVMMATVMWALGLTATLWRATWTWWATAAFHALVVVGLRLTVRPQWWMELIAGLLVWGVATALIGRQRLVVQQAWRVLARRK